MHEKRAKNCSTRSGKNLPRKSVFFRSRAGKAVIVGSLEDLKKGAGRARAEVKTAFHEAISTFK
jgi:hypothetical protein